MVVRSRQLRQGCALILTLACSGAVFGETYYVSNTGSDANDGLTALTPWATVSKVNTLSPTFTPGTNVLFERGDIWRESLVAGSSGTAVAPIVYGAYGDTNLAKPTFFGSDVLQNANFTLVSGSTYSIATPFNPGSVFINQQYMHSSALLVGLTQALTYTQSTANTWFYDNVTQKLYVNTGGVNPLTDSRLYTASARQSIVSNGAQSYVTFNNLATDETARWEGGTGFDIQGGVGVRIENSDAFRAGKHNFSAINADGFVGSNLYASDTMPDLGGGAASAYVSFSDINQVAAPTTSTWNNIVADKPNGDYPVFITHGSGVGKVIINNLTAKGSGLYIAGDIQEGAFELHGGSIENGTSAVNSNKSLIDGLKMSGDRGSLVLGGSQITVQNLLVDHLKPDSNYKAAVLDGGQGNTIRFSTFVLRDDGSNFTTAIALIVPNTGTRFYGNIIDSAPVFLENWAPGAIQFLSDHNLFSDFPYVMTSPTTVISFGDWLAMVNSPDAHSVFADPMFVDLGNGDYRLLVGSPGIDAFTPDQLDQILTDYFGNGRPSGSAFDFGAIEAVPEPASLAVLGLGALALLRRRRAV